MLTIAQVLDALRTAIYGEEVRTAISDGISQCYSDVSASKTLADTAVANADTKAALADTAAANANTKATLANDKATLADTAATNANTAAANANTKATLANTKATLANDKATLADTAATNANTKATLANDKATLADTAATNANTKATLANDKATLADTAAANANTKATLANDKAALADTAATNANTAATLANDKAALADTAAANANAKATLADTAAANATDKVQGCAAAAQDATNAASAAEHAAQKADNIATSLENMTITSESEGPYADASALLTTVDGHKNIHFVLKQGEQGDPFKVIGMAYPTLEVLQATITMPLVGDQYNVGQIPPYTIYRWTGTTKGWESQGVVQGPQGIQGEQGIPGLPGEKGDTGPNAVTGATTTNIDGLLKGNGTVLRAVPGVDYPKMVKIWEGTWSSGAITVADINKYALFIVHVGAVFMLVSRIGTYFRGGTLYNSSNTAISYFLSAIISGTTLTLENCSSISHLSNGNHGSNAGQSVLEIFGFLQY